MADSLQTETVKSKFMEALQRYQLVEQQQRQRQKDRVARQFKIVKQDATSEEIAEVVNSVGEGSKQIFATAVGALIYVSLVFY